MSYREPCTPDVLAMLPPAQLTELRVWSKNHHNIFDLRIHSIFTCPLLSYPTAYLFIRPNKLKWAWWLHYMFGHKHSEENHCKCVDEIAASMK
jgi:hypothetical protein